MHANAPHMCTSTISWNLSTLSQVLLWHIPFWHAFDAAPAPPRLHEVLAHIDRFLPEGDDSRWGPLRTTVGEVEYSLNQHREAIWSTGGDEEWEFVLWYKAPYESVDPNERAELRRILARIQQLERGEDESLPYWLADVLQHGVFKRKTHGRRTR